MSSFTPVQIKNVLQVNGFHVDLRGVEDHGLHGGGTGRGGGQRGRDGDGGGRFFVPNDGLFDFHLSCAGRGTEGGSDGEAGGVPGDCGEVPLDSRAVAYCTWLLVKVPYTRRYKRIEKHHSRTHARTQTPQTKLTNGSILAHIRKVLVHLALVAIDEFVHARHEFLLCSE